MMVIAPLKVLATFPAPPPKMHCPGPEMLMSAEPEMMPPSMNESVSLASTERGRAEPEELPMSMLTLRVLVPAPGALQKMPGTPPSKPRKPARALSLSASTRI